MQISIHALHEESDSSDYVPLVQLKISIHALHEESDPPNSTLLSRSSHFNPRSP